MKLDLQKLTEAHTSLGKIITVCKAGAPSAETLQSLEGDLAKVQQAIVSIDAGDTSIDPVGIKSRMGEIKTLAEGLAGSTHDLNVADQLDALLEKVKEVTIQVEAMPATTPVEPVVATPAVETPAVETPATPAVAATPETPAVATTPATPVVPETPATPAVEAAPATPATETPAAEETPAADAAAEGGDEGEAETVTKADLVALGSTIADAFKASIGELATTLKSAGTGRPSLLPPSVRSETAPLEQPEDWGNQFDLNAK